MEITRSGDRSAVYGGRFTGRVELEMLAPAASPGAPDTARVHFFDGAVTSWHRHPGGQQLVLVSGAGRAGVDVRGEEIAPGALVVFPADERHWHGAAAGQDCVWLAVTWGVTDWEDGAPALS